MLLLGSVPATKVKQVVGCMMKPIHSHILTHVYTDTYTELCIQGCLYNVVVVCMGMRRIQQVLFSYMYHFTRILCVLTIQVTERLTRLVHSRQGGIIVVEGDPGMGKTRLLEELEHESMNQQQSVDAAPGELPAIRKLCNIFVANGDLANKSKVTCSHCKPGLSHCIYHAAYIAHVVEENMHDFMFNVLGTH